MKTIRVMSLALALVCSPILTSCSDDSKNRQAEAEQFQAIEDLIAAVHTVEQDFAQGFLLKDATERDRTELKQNLYDLKIATYRLRNNPYDSDALAHLYQAFMVYDKLNLLEDDRARLGGLDVQLRATLDAVATLQGKTLEGIERPLFQKYFNLELAPFAATKTWRIDGTRDKKYVIGDGKATAWLLSPRMDLSQVGSPAFMVDQAINERGLPFLDGVMYLVSQDYVSGDPEQATWESIKINSMPDGSSYNYRKSEAVSLSAYAGKKIVIAFKLDGEKLKFMPGTAKSAWQISSFTLLGTGKVNYEQLNLAGSGSGNGGNNGGEVAGPARDLPLPYVKSFRDNAFTNFAVASSASTSEAKGWTIYKYTSGDSCCAKVGGSNTTSWLLSPRYDLSKVQNPQFFYRQAITREPENDDVISVLITTDESLADLSKVKWERVTFTKKPKYDPKYVFENTEMIDLSRYAGKKIVIAYKYQLGETSSWPIWEIDSMQILGSGTLSHDPVTVGSLGDDAPVVPTPEPEPTVPSLYKKVFKDTGLTDFAVETTQGLAANGWNVFTIPNRPTPCCLKVAGSELTSWLASPRFDLTDVKNPQVWFRQSIAKLEPAATDVMTVWVTTDENITSLATAQWEPLTAIKVPAYTDKFVWENSETFDLSPYAGKKIVIGFRYQSPVINNWPTWELDSLQLEGNGTLKMEPVVLTPSAG
ncbi:choice-of-anchor J domain-containing protein [Oligoflexus tunisiensis]|uniref:choice-of-anchor J domain-containing protein n=1 Tax=Oligoflexus tunisiensis TaxID=708132 RepID=UPI00114CF484|nr:choice-of-anchor J domain-containing protein [Oligoflexus tunisiensis]